MTTIEILLMFLITFEFQFFLDNVEVAEVFTKERKNANFLCVGMLEFFNPIQERF